MLVAYNRAAKCHTFWRLVVPSGAPTNALQTEQLPYIVAVKLYSEPEGASAEVSRRLLGSSFVCNRHKSAPLLSAPERVVNVDELALLVMFVLSTASHVRVHHQRLD